MTAEMMKLRVMVPNLVGKETVLINVSSSSTVLELKRLLAAQISADLKIEDLKLIYLGRLLPDLSLLSYWLQPTHLEGSLLPTHLDGSSLPTHLEGNSNLPTHLEGGNSNKVLPTHLEGCLLPTQREGSSKLSNHLEGHRSNRLLPSTHLEGRDLSLHPCTDSSDLLHLKSDLHTLHLAYPPTSPFTLNKNSFLLEESSKDDALCEQQQAQLAELYSTYLYLYWQSLSQSEEGPDLDLRRISDMLGNTAAAPAPIVTPPAPATIITPPLPASNPPPPEAYLEVLWGLLTCLIHSFLTIAILHFYGSLNLVKFALAFAFACLVIFLGKEAMRRDEEMSEEEEDADNAEAEEFVEDEAEQGGTFAILISNFSLFFSSVFPEGIHLRV